MAYSETSALVLEAIRRSCAELMRREGHVVDGRHTFDHILNNLDKYDWLFKELSDSESHEILSWLIRFRIAFFLDQSKDYWEARKRTLALFPPQMFEGHWAELATRASAHPANKLAESFDVDVVENWILDGYSLPGECEVREGDTVLDCGAFNGNSSIVLAKKAGPTGKVYAFEPNPEMVPVLEQNLATTNAYNVQIVQAALSDKPGSVRFSPAGAGSRLDDGGSVEVEVMTIDEFVSSKDLKRVDFIKFDIEGFELPALHGAADTIRRFRPKLAISVYHLHYDITDIPFYVKNLCQWYKLFLRHNAPYDGEIVLFMKPIGRIGAEVKI